MATVPTYNLTWQQGSDGLITLVYKESVDGGTPAAVDLSSGYAVRMDVRNASKTLLYTFNSADIVETPPVDTTGSADNEGALASDGTITITVPRAITLPGGVLVNEIGNTLSYDIVLRNTVANTQKKLLKGTITIEESTTLWT